MIEYHPHSEKRSRVLSPEEFKQSFIDESDPTVPPDDEPWRPFRSREDFEFAELVNDASLNQNQIKKFIKLIQRCQNKPGAFTFQNYSDLESTLADSSKLLTPVTMFQPY